MVVNNTIFSTDENPTTICTIYVIDREGDDGEGGEYGSNHSTICFNNITDLISSYYSDERWDTFPLPDGVFSNYVAYYTSNYIITDLLMDVDNRDFRPTFFQDLIEAGVVDPEMDEGVAELYERYKSDFLDSEDTSPDMGAVGYNTDEYIIAGRQEAISSAPIPADGAFSSSAGLMLSWKPAYESTASTLYMGTSYDQVFNASPQDIAHIEGNITSSLYYPSKSSYPINQRATTYYWRVDDLVDNNIIKGDVWNFQLY